jgi:hypothetical protein
MYGDEEFWAEVTTCFREFVESHFKKLKAENAALEAKVARLEAALEARPGLKYVGTFREGRVFEENSFCTYDGNVWHCNQRTSVPPGNGSAAWTLAVKHGERGRDGKDGKDANGV